MYIYINLGVEKHLTPGRCINMLSHRLIFPLGGLDYSTEIHEDNLEAPVLLHRHSEWQSRVL